MQCQRLVLVGDAHLGRSPPEAEAAFLAFLQAVPTLGDGLVVTGDLFEFWFAYHRAIPRRGVRVVAALAALRRRVPILLAGGNHDRWGDTFWQNELGIEHAGTEGTFTLAGRPGVVVHGDDVSPLDWSARLLQRVTRHRGTVALFRAVHPDLGMWLVDRLSGVLRDRPRQEEEIATSARRQEAWARARLARDSDLGLLVMGHTHRPAAVEVAPGRFYLNPGAWFDGYRFAVCDGRSATLHRFSP